jgi:5,10-methylenetetrahydromethanopterin reductase
MLGGTQGNAVPRLALIVDTPTLRGAVDAAMLAEARGYEKVLVGEPAGAPDAFVRAAAILAATERIRVGPGVVNVHDRHPLALARAAAALDRLGPGRALLGVGRGDPGEIERTLHIPAALAGAALEDALRICGPLLRGEGVTWRGRRWSAELAAPQGEAAPSSAVPLLCAAVGPRTLRLAGALADGVILNYGAAPEYVQWAVAQVAEAALEAGRQPEDVDILGIVLVARTDVAGAERGIERVRRILESVFQIPDQGRALGAPAGGVPSEVDDGAVRRFAAVGDAAEIAERLEAYRAAGLRCPVLMPSSMRALHDD